MSTINKVLYNIDQTNDTTTQEKKQARDNIQASQVNYVNAVGGVPTVTPGDLNLVTYQSGLHLNDGTSNISPLAPEAQQGDTGKILTVKSTGIGWSNNQPARDIFIQLYRNNSLSSGVSNVIQSIELPKVGNMYPTKVFGSFDCYPDTGYTGMAVCPMKSNNYGSGSSWGAGGSYDPYVDADCVNVHSLLALSSDHVGADGQYRNTVNFSFTKKDGVQGDITYIGIKGSSAEGEGLGFHVHNIQIQCFYETEG